MVIHEKPVIGTKIIRWVEEQAKKPVERGVNFVVVGFDKDGKPSEYPQRERKSETITTREVGFGC